MIFPKLEAEAIVQINDKTRLDARKTFVSSDDVLRRIEIDPGTGVYYDVTSDGYLDFAYSVDQIYTPLLRLNSDNVTDQVFTASQLEIISVGNDNLFSDDKDLINYEDDILNYVREGRNSFLDKHRLAQSMIMDEIARQGIRNPDDDSLFTADQLVNIQEFNEWSATLTLSIIFNSLNNSSEDIFSIKANNYNSMAILKKKRALMVLELDVTGSGSTEETVINSTWDGELRRG